MKSEQSNLYLQSLSCSFNKVFPLSAIAASCEAIMPGQNLPWFKVNSTLPNFGKHGGVSLRWKSVTSLCIYEHSPGFCSSGREQRQLQESAKAQDAFSYPLNPRGSHPPQDKMGQRHAPHDPVTFNTSLCWDERIASMGTWELRPRENPWQTCSNRHCPGPEIYKQPRFLRHLAFSFSLGVSKQVPWTRFPWCLFHCGTGVVA